MLKFVLDPSLDSVAVAALHVGDDIVIVYNPALADDLPVWLLEDVRLTSCA